MPAELQDRTQRHPAQARAPLARAQHPRRRRPQRRSGAGTDGPAPRIRAGAVDGMGSPLSPMRCAGNRRARPSRVRGRSIGPGGGPTARTGAQSTHSLTRSHSLMHALARARTHARAHICTRRRVRSSTRCWRSSRASTRSARTRCSRCPSTRPPSAGAAYLCRTLVAGFCVQQQQQQHARTDDRNQE
jgi:hypothetical protein